MRDLIQLSLAQNACKCSHLKSAQYKGPAAAEIARAIETYV